MSNSRISALHKLLKIYNQYDPASSRLKKDLLFRLSKMPLAGNKNMLDYHNLLLFLCAYPGDEHMLILAEAELNRIAQFGKQKGIAKNGFPENEGMPFTITNTRFSPDFLTWLLKHPDLRVEFDTFNDPSLALNDVLNITLPAVLKAETTAGLNNADLMSVFNIKPHEYIPFLLGQLQQLNEMPLLQELFNERLDAYIKLIPKNKIFSRSYNRIPVKHIHFHQKLIRQFDSVQLVNEPLLPLQTISKKTALAIQQIIKNSMALTVREIDPATFLNEKSMRLCNLKNGLILAVYSMIPKRQLPLETYFGFTFFQNGIPVSYGGIWVFGPMAKIGLNIFEPFRGGESGYILNQLIRVLKQAFGVTYIEIEPYQFGLDNPGGISSGAFWFYHKYGFRPVDPALKLLAKKEYHKIKTKQNYRSSEATLLRFTEGNIGLNMGKKIPLNVLTVMAKILSAIKKEWPNNYDKARQNAIQKFCKKLNINTTGLTKTEKDVLEEMALWKMAMGIKKADQLKLMREMVYTKTKDDFAYQQLLIGFCKL